MASAAAAATDDVDVNDDFRSLSAAAARRLE